MKAPRDFWLLWGGTSASNLGDGIRVTALPLLAVTLTTDPVAIGAVTAASFLPWFALSLVAGAVTDRRDRRTLILTGQIIRAVAVAIFVVLVATDRSNLAFVYVIALIVGAGEVVVDSAMHAAIPQVAGDDLDRANSRISSARFVAGEIVGGPVGGLLFTVAAALPFLVDAATFVIGAVLVGLIATPLQEPSTTEPKTSILADIAEGGRFLWNQRVLRGLATAVALSNLADTAVRALMVLLVVDILGGSEIQFGLILTAGALGGFAGSIAAPRAVGLLGRRSSVVVAFAVMAAANATIGLAPNLMVVAGGAFLVLFAVGLFNVSSHSIRQRLTPDRLLGRVVASMRFVGIGVIPIGGLLGGLVARQIGVRQTILVAAAVGAIATSAVTFATAGQDLEPEPTT